MDGINGRLNVEENISKLFFNLFNIYSFLRDTERQSVSGKRGDTEFKAGSRLKAVSTEPNAGLEPTNHEIMTWAEIWRLMDWATQGSLLVNLNIQQKKLLKIEHREKEVEEKNESSISELRNNLKNSKLYITEVTKGEDRNSFKDRNYQSSLRWKIVLKPEYPYIY